MPRYAITERAGPFVAGIRNTGVGTVLDLTERQAEHELRLGSLVALPLVGGTPEVTPSDPAWAGSGEPASLLAADPDAETSLVRKPKRSAP
jgi:hypothetical protein